MIDKDRSVIYKSVCIFLNGMVCCKRLVAWY